MLAMKAHCAILDTLKLPADAVLNVFHLQAFFHWDRPLIVHSAEQLCQEKARDSERGCFVILMVR